MTDPVKNGYSTWQLFTEKSDFPSFLWHSYLSRLESEKNTFSKKYTSPTLTLTLTDQYLEEWAMDPYYRGDKNIQVNSKS